MNQQMYPQKKTPVKALKEIFASGKITFISVCLSIAALVSVISAFAERNAFGTFSIFGFDIDLKSMPGIGEIVSLVANVILVFTIIGLIPLILSAVGFWLVKLGAKEGKANTKKAVIGLNFFKIFLFINAMFKYLAALGVVIIGLFALFAGSQLLGEHFNGLLIIVIVLAAAGVLFLYGQYYSKFLMMVTGVSNTLRSGKNLVTKSSFVVVINWIIAIFGMIQSVFSVFGGGTAVSGLIGLVGGVCEGLCLIFIMTSFTDYEKACGYVTAEESKATFEALRTDPAEKAAADALGIVQTAEGQPPQRMSFMSFLFGMGIADENDTYTAQGPASYAATPVYNTSPAYAAPPVHNAAPVQQNQPNYAYAPPYYQPVGNTAQILTLFGTFAEPLDGRYSLLGSIGEAPGFACPIVPVSMQVVRDSVSEKKILRMHWENRSPVAIRSARFDITPMDNANATLGTIRGVTFNFDASVNSGESLLEKNGIIIPDNATHGSVKVSFLEFADGLTWDKTSSDAFFVTDEKRNYDIAVAERELAARERAAREEEMRRQQAQNAVEEEQEERKFNGWVVLLILASITLFILLFAGRYMDFGCASGREATPAETDPSGIADGGENAHPELDGSGTLDDPYIINTADQLLYLSRENGGIYNEHYKLNSDINLGGEQWYPLSMGNNSSFDGNNFTVSNFTIENNTDSSYNLGFFDSVYNGSSIKNLRLDNFRISASSNGNFLLVGALAGEVDKGTEEIALIQNCRATNGAITISDFSGSVGGLVGNMHGVDISSCYAAVAIDAYSENSDELNENYGNGLDIGGLVGLATDSSIHCCKSTNRVYARSYCSETTVGGLVGSLYDSDVESCYSSSHIEVSAFESYLDRNHTAHAGGLIGYAHSGSSKNTYIKESFCDGSVSVEGTSNSYAGGFIGSSSGNGDGYKTIINNSFSTGNVEIDVNVSDTSFNANGGFAGGFAGRASHTYIKNVYTTSAVSVVYTGSATLCVGGIVGSSGSDDTFIEKSVSFSQITGTADNIEPHNIYLSQICGGYYSVNINNCYYDSRREIYVTYNGGTDYPSVYDEENEIPVSPDEYYSESFFPYTLGWDHDVWNFYGSNSLPQLPRSVYAAPDENGH